MNDRGILRSLAERVTAVAALPDQDEKVRLWTACNDLHPERPMVFADPQNGWRELDQAWLELSCEGEFERQIEKTLKRRLLRHEHIPDDYPILDTLDIPLQVSGSGYDSYGLDLTVSGGGATDRAYHIEPAIKTEDDLQRLHFRPLVIDHSATEQHFLRAEELLGDILRVRKVGKTYWRYGLTRVLVHMRGLDQMMLDMYDNPELLHRLLSFLRDDFLREIELYERENALSLNNTPDNITGSGGLSPTKDLPTAGDNRTTKTEHCICWAESQETVGVGPAQFEEFVLAYQLPLMQRFGLVDYGCCETLDQKFDLLIEHIPHLRWISVSPWTNRELAAEKIGNRCVFVYKPNPSRICSPVPNWSEAERDIRETFDIAGDCAMHIVLKDTQTFCGEPHRITEWAKRALRLAQESV